VSTVIEVSEVTLRRGRTFLLDHLSWKVDQADRWVIIGPNGAGKTTLLQLVSANMFPTTGEVRLLGNKLGDMDVFELRPLIGIASAGLEAQIPLDELVLDVVMSSAYAVFGRWREEYTAVDEIQAEKLMTKLRVNSLAGRRFGTLSEGERQRVHIARALMSDPEILLLDEPTAGLDLAGREYLLSTLAEFSEDPMAPTLAMVTHHVEEIPHGITHALFMKQGRSIAMGPIHEVMTSEVLSRTFDMPLKVMEIRGRWYAQAA